MKVHHTVAGDSEHEKQKGTGLGINYIVTEGRRGSSVTGWANASS